MCDWVGDVGMQCHACRKQLFDVSATSNVTLRRLPHFSSSVAAGQPTPAPLSDCASFDVVLETAAVKM